ncbi:MAG: hypothetical protein LUE26_06290 [Alistipes sp.]|nr:hypothetical protein [Alistipes sp.]
MVVDGDLNIYGERLWFSMNGYRTDAVITTDKREYRLREKVDLGIEVPGSDGVSPAFMSVSVTDDSDVSAVPESSVFTSLLLASDLRGYIEYPGFYFAPGLLREVALDILMMVNGWRRYEVPEVLRGEYAIPEHPLEVGQELSGRVDYAVGDRAMEGSRVSMISFPDSFFDTTVTDGDGTFAFNGFELPDSTVFVVQALNRRGRKLAVLHLDEQVFPEVGQPLPVRRFRYSLNAPYLQKADRKYTDEHGIRIIDIDEVSVRGNRRAPGNLYSYDFADNLYEEEQLGHVKGTFEDFMRRLPRVMFERNVPLMQERGGRYRPINYIVDGIMLFDDYFSVRHIPMHSIKSIVVYNPDNIFFIPGLRQGGWYGGDRDQNRRRNSPRHSFQCR